MVVILAIFNVFVDIVETYLTLEFSTSTLGIFSGLVEFIAPIVLLMALSKAIKSATDITKRMFGA